MIPQLESKLGLANGVPAHRAGNGPDSRSEESKAFLSLLDVLGDKWTVLLFDLLATGPTRFGELGRQVDGISNKALSQALRNLQALGLVDRRQFPTIPPKVIYSLTAKGETLVDPLAEVLSWAHLNPCSSVPSQKRRKTRWPILRPNSNQPC